MEFFCAFELQIARRDLNHWLLEVTSVQRLKDKEATAIQGAVDLDLIVLTTMAWASKVNKWQTKGGASQRSRLCGGLTS